MLNLKKVLEGHGSTQKALALACRVSPATVAQIANHGLWPRSLDTQALQEKVREFLRGIGASPAELDTAFDLATEGAEPARSNAPAPLVDTPKLDPEEQFMLLRRQTLHPAAKRHFALSASPFADDLASHEDVYRSPDIRYISEAMLHTAKHGGFTAITSESGGGKTLLLRDLEDRIQREGLPIVLVKPYVLAMEDNDQKGKTLKATHIAEALMAAVSPLERPKSSPEARFAQLHRALKESHAAGNKHCLVIDEAHALPIPTLKHLKRFFELELGFTKLLAILLLGQPELRAKLAESKQEVREVVQRCEVLELAPLDGRLEEYLKFRAGRIGKPLADIIDASGIEALRTRLTLTNQRDRRDTHSLLYPLAVGNLLTAAMNLAADIGAPVVSADVVRAV